MPPKLSVPANLLLRDSNNMEDYCMRYRKLTTIMFAFVLIIGCASCSECWIAQEYTQITVKVKAVAEWLNTIEMKLNQLKMLAQLPQSVINQINGMKELLAENEPFFSRSIPLLTSLTTSRICSNPDILSGRKVSTLTN